MLRRILLPVVIAALAAAAPCIAQEFPTRPVRLVVPYPPGGSADLIGRMLAERLAQSLGQPMVVENRGGASGAVGSEAVARAEADGYTLLIGLSDTHAINPAVSPHLSYNPQRDFAPISLLAVQPFLLVVGPQMRIGTLAEFLRTARERPGTVTYGSNGTGGLQHLAMELLSSEAGVRMLHVPYRGAAPALADVMAGHLNAIFISMQGAGSNLSSGGLRPLASTSSARLAALHDVPTFAESGYPAFQVNQWYGLLAPRGTPARIVVRLSEQASAAMLGPAIADRLRSSGTEPVGSSAEAFREFMAQEIARWAAVASAHNIRVE